MIELPSFHFAPFSRKQLQLLTWWLPESGVSDADGIIADGAVRSGKTVPMSLGYTMWAMACFHGQNFGMAGKSIGAFRRNVLSPLKQMLRGRGYTLEDHRADNMVEISRGRTVNYFYIFGGRDERSQDLIQGITLAGMLFDEVALMPQSFVEQAEARCSVTGAKLWYNCNPGGPMHWFKTDRVDDCDAQNLLHLHFLMDDNLSLSPEVKQRYVNRFSSSPVFFQRYILGLWTAAEGVIYPMYEDALEPRFSEIGSEYGMSIDYGTQNAFAAGIWAKSGRTWHMTDEYRYSGRDEGIQKTDAEYVEDMVAFVKAKIPKAALDVIVAEGGLDTFVDPSAASFIAALRREDLFHVRKARNEVADGIRDVAVCLKLGKIRIADSCSETRLEFAGYVWEDDDQEDRPVKVNDHLMDMIRYFVHTKRLVRDIDEEEQYTSPFLIGGR